MTDMLEIERMTLHEMNLRQKAYALRTVDRMNDIHMQAWASRAVKATKKSGKDKEVYVYDTYDKFFNYQEKEAEALNKKDSKKEKIFSSLEKIAKNIEERRKINGKL